MHTCAIYEGVNPDGSLSFDMNASVYNGFDRIKIISLNKGTMTIEPQNEKNVKDCDLFILSHIAAGCFNSKSNLYGIKRIKFTYNGINISVTEKNATPEKIERQYYKKLNKLEVI